MKNYAKSGESSLANIVHIQGKNFYKVNQVGSSFKLIEEEEKSTLTRIINTLLSGDIYLHKIIPINPARYFHHKIAGFLCQKRQLRNNHKY